MFCTLISYHWPVPRLWSSCSSNVFWISGPTQKFALLRSGPVWSACERLRPAPTRPSSANGPKRSLRPTASGTGLVLGERFRALIGFVWPARNGTASDTATAAAGSDGTGSAPVPVPKLQFSPAASPASACLFCFFWPYSFHRLVFFRCDFR